MSAPTALEGGNVPCLFTLKDDLKWSDGTALDAQDFEYAWKRAASGELAADYGYMFDAIDGFGEADVEGLAPLNVTALAETYDVIIGQVQASSDPEERFARMHEAENQLMETGAIGPIYYHTDLDMISPELGGFLASPLG